MRVSTSQQLASLARTSRSYRAEKELKASASQEDPQVSYNTHESDGENVMKSTTVTKAPPTTQPALFNLTASDTFVERTRQISAAIARRAYELFEARGSEHGHDWEDWFRAESELLTPISATVVATDGGFRVTAELPGFTGKDVGILAEPRRLIIHAKKQETLAQEKETAVVLETMSGEMYRVLELPHEIDPDNMTVTIKNGVLEVTLAKVSPGKKTAVGVKAA